jgi:cytoplasmic iron level regulating protein YaaA (DUF328/UPF0246 family)
MIILLHTSKTMRPPNENANALQQPELFTKAIELAQYLKTLSPSQIAKTMHVSSKLAEKTYALIQGWTSEPHHQRPALDSFIGDIYSGLQVSTWAEADRSYANDRLRILSGLYGILRPFEGIYPYRLELGYKLPKASYANLYTYWGDTIAKTLSGKDPIINLSAVEYSKIITPYIDTSRITTPSFLTTNQETKEPTFVAVHAKIARGAFAAWLIKQRIAEIDDMTSFAELGYDYDKNLSTPQMPVFICKSFEGLGLSIRLT